MTGYGRADLEETIRDDRERAERIAQGGIGALSTTEIIHLGIVAAVVAALQSEFTDDEQAALLLAGSRSGMTQETSIRTGAKLEEMDRICAASGLPFPAQNLTEFLQLIRMVAEPIARQIALRMRGFIN